MPAPAAAALGAGRLAGLALTNRRTLLWLRAPRLRRSRWRSSRCSPRCSAAYRRRSPRPAAPSPTSRRRSRSATSRPPTSSPISRPRSTYGVGWEYLAAIGKIESDHGRGSAAGIRSGVNFAGCCAGPMQFLITGAGGGTWGAYGVDGDDDGRRDVYDPDDAIPAAANYLKASGAPDDWDRAIFAYNHAAWYVADVKALAERYRGAPIGSGGAPLGPGSTQTLPLGQSWLAAVPGTRAVCDRRIVARRRAAARALQDGARRLLLRRRPAQLAR